jgi:peptidoglycan hydrolase CwlO-like protein
MQDSGEPAPLEKTQSLPGQECFLFTYVLLKEEKDGILALFKLVSVHDDPKKCQQDYIRAEPTNKQCIMKWGVTGEWEVIRRPETDTEGTIDIVHMPDEDEEFMGEKLSSDKLKGERLTREVLKDNSKGESIRDRASIDTYKENVKLRIAQEKRLELRKKAMAELQGELDDPKSLASYARMQWQRLTQKSAIAEYKEKVEEGQKALLGTLKELHSRRRMFPHYENKWRDEIRRIHKLMAAKKADENPVDRPIASLDYDDDEMLANAKLENPHDEFDTNVGVERKGKKENQENDGNGEEKIIGKGKEELTDADVDKNQAEIEAVEKTAKEIGQRVDGLQEDVNKTEDAIARSFLPDAPIQKLKAGLGKPKGKKNKKRK